MLENSSPEATGTSQGEKILDDPASLGVFLVKKLGMKLDAIDSAPLLLHRLNFAVFVGGGGAEAVGQFLHLVAVVVPDG